MVSNTLFRAESIMTKQPKDTSKQVTQPDKKKSETVQLTPEDLKAISGGAGIGNRHTTPQAEIAGKQQIKK
jgi:hypothetical protein